MPHTLPPLPSPQMLAEARHRVANPQLHIHEPDFQERNKAAFWLLWADKQIRIEAKRAATVISAAFPEDAA